ncbi:BTAD domain-containing putative transcriptional regulator [Micromonospora sp. WMMD1120]|uniref:BTAD domain-containing putative transcriptional regulator n=1 Tax=Micromonospora sp. WMMD1120 TaxID=3016106 RepID=UPI0024178D07|nr:BTAD domain-containing putative transcriptional regulator [Micromonospora sp. WMMD1120]MDG4809621.1 BTAD domain-containing putative transcriptional regulator [Micromonospora sp. WMMD1120]
MQITTLGPLAVDGRPVRGERLAAVVRALVDARGRAVSTALLVDAVWDGAPPDDANGAVQALVSRVRRLGLPVLAAPGGYRLPAEEVTVDAVEARTLVDSARTVLHTGDASGARDLADRARALFPEVPELATAEDTRLFADVTALRAQAALAGAGPYDEVDLGRLVARTPPDEPSAALLVRVLAAQGREAEALEVVERLRTDLADRYGTDPSPVIAEVHLALLRGELTTPTGGTPPRRPARGALPAAWRRPLTTLVGRERDVESVTDSLAETPLVTIVATGGAGKTRLAAEVTRHAVAAGQTVRVVELAGLRSPDEVLPTVLAALGGADTTPTGGNLGLERRVLNPEERLRAVAPDLDGLVVLDNCEHVLDAVAVVVADLLAATSADVAVLATSRAPLGLAGERVHRLTTLPDADALALIESRARAGGAVSTGDTERTLALCHRLDNLPLALELAAARLRHMPIDDVLSGLTDRFALLDDALRGLPERHASLWAMVDWSRELLAPDDRQLLQRVAVIPAAFTADLAAAVAGRPDVRRGLATLVEQSLLTLVEGEGPPRYRMLETVREYGEARLDETGDREPATAGLVDWARGESVALAGRFVGPDQVEALNRCAAEQDNLVAALRWSLAGDDEPASIDVASALFFLWTVRGLHVEVLGWARGLLHVDEPRRRRHSAILGGRSAGRPLPDADRLVRTGLVIGVNAGISGDLRLAVIARRALRTTLAERRTEVSARQAALASALPGFDTADPEQSMKGASEMIAHPDPYVQALGYFARAAVRENSGSPQASVGDAEQAYRRFEATGDHWGMAMAAGVVGQFLTLRDGARATDWLTLSLQHMEVIGAAQDARSIRVRLDARLALDGDRDAERRLTDTAAGDAEAMDIAQARLGLAHLAWQRERYDEALRHAEAVTRVLIGWAGAPPQPRVIFRVAVAVLRLRLARVRPGAEPFDQAAALLALARDEALGSNDLPVIGAWALGGAELAAHRGDAATARDLFVLGSRIGGHVGIFLPPGDQERLSAALGTEEQREPLQAAWRERPVAAVVARIRELMDDLLG